MPRQNGIWWYIKLLKYTNDDLSQIGSTKVKGREKRIIYIYIYKDSNIPCLFRS